jgi:elongator complex protein 1
MPHVCRLHCGSGIVRSRTLGAIGFFAVQQTQDWEVISEVPLFEADSEQPTAAISSGDVALSWRGDGKYFATIAELRVTGECAIRIWEESGGPAHAFGEHAAGLEVALAWQPNGRHLYAVQRLDGRSQVLLYERNGLRHGGFPVSSTGTTAEHCCC